VSAPYGIRDHRGYYGAFTREWVCGALQNGVRVVKVKAEDGDANRVGALGTVLGSILAGDRADELGYFIEWDSAPNVAVFVMGWKVEPAPSGA
jgi:hypothetical protein